VRHSSMLRTAVEVTTYDNEFAAFYNELMERFVRATADQLRRDLQTKAEEEASATVARAQDEIRAERDRVFEDLRAQIGDIAVELAARVVNQSLDKQAHEKLIDDYIEQVATGDKGQG